MAKLAAVRQAFRDVTAVVEAVGALRSLGGEDALIEMALFAQSHEQTVERAWRALAECEDVARRVSHPSPVASVAPLPSVPASPASEEPALATERVPPTAVAAESPPADNPALLAGEGAPVPEIAAAAPERGEADAAVEEESPVTQVDALPSRVLVVDDDPAVLRAFRRVLQANHEIVTARDGSEALQIVLSGARVDAIICDIGMPKLDGPAFFSELFELRPQLMPRVVFCTGGLPNEKTQRFLERLQAPLLFKPVPALELQRAIDAARAR
ncbi:MAG TPA: response regulator [Polyangiaceae bacterium]|nr:response regulator [Polyangiaceae bacterium]